MIAEIREEVDGYIDPLVEKMMDFGDNLVVESKLLETEESDLRRELQELAIYLSDGQDVTICLDIALEDSDDIFQNRGLLFSYTY